MLPQMHREDIKASIRKAFGSVKAFEEARGLPNGSVHDLFRGRKSARVSRAINDVLTNAPPVRSDKLDNSADATAAPRLNTEAR